MGHPEPASGLAALAKVTGKLREEGNTTVCGFLTFVCSKENLHWSRIGCSLVMRTQVILINDLLHDPPANAFKSSGGYSASWTWNAQVGLCSVHTEACACMCTCALAAPSSWILHEHNSAQNQGFGSLYWLSLHWTFQQNAAVSHLDLRGVQVEGFKCLE